MVVYHTMRWIALMDCMFPNIRRFDGMDFQGKTLLVEPYCYRYVIRVSLYFMRTSMSLEYLYFHLILFTNPLHIMMMWM